MTKGYAYKRRTHLLLIRYNVGRTFLSVEPPELNTYIQYTHDVKVHLRLSAQCRGKDTTFSAIMQEV